MRRAIGVSVHTGWGACVVVSDSRERPQIIANARIEVLGEAERFCFHRAAEMPRAQAERWLLEMRDKAVRNARRAFGALLSEVSACAVVARAGMIGPLEQSLASHPRFHRAEACFYRDVFREACSIPCQIVPPEALDPSKVGRVGITPWGRDQKLAALAAWSVLGV